MIVFLSKLFAIPLNPVGLSLTLLVLGFVYIYALRRRKAGMIFIYCGAAALLFFSLPITSHVLMRGLESRYTPVRIYEQADAVVFLGGATSGKVAPRMYVETNINADRVFHAVRMYRETFSPKLVLTGGNISYMSNDTVPEAHSAFELLHELFGIDTSDVIIEYEARNTRENAVYTKMALEQRGYGTEIVLVTNAYHMPRSVGIFKKAGFDKIIPAPTGYFADEKFSFKPMMMMPNATALHQSAIAMHEYYGLVAYKLMGWI